MSDMEREDEIFGGIICHSGVIPGPARHGLSLRGKRRRAV